MSGERKETENSHLLFEEISEQARDFVTVISSSSIEGIDFTEDGIKELIIISELQKDSENIMKLLTNLKVLPEKDERKGK